MQISEVVDQLKSCDFECEAGALEMNTAFVWLTFNAQMLDECIAASKHTHRAGKGENIDRCLSCGHDIRHIIHRR